MLMRRCGRRPEAWQRTRTVCSPRATMPCSACMRRVCSATGACDRTLPLSKAHMVSPTPAVSEHAHSARTCAHAHSVRTHKPSGIQTFWLAHAGNPSASEIGLLGCGIDFSQGRRGGNHRQDRALTVPLLQCEAHCHAPHTARGAKHAVARLRARQSATGRRTPTHGRRQR